MFSAVAILFLVASLFSCVAILALSAAFFFSRGTEGGFTLISGNTLFRILIFQEASLYRYLSFEDRSEGGMLRISSRSFNKALNLFSSSSSFQVVDLSSRELHASSFTGESSFSPSLSGVTFGHMGASQLESPHVMVVAFCVIVLSQLDSCKSGPFLFSLALFISKLMLFLLSERLLR